MYTALVLAATFLVAIATGDEEEFLAVGGVIALAGWFLLGFDAIYLASFRLSRSGAVVPAILLMVEIGVVASLLYWYRRQRASQIASALPVIWLCNLANVVFVVFWGGL